MQYDSRLIFLAVLAIILFLFIFFLPSILARKKRNFTTVFLINLFLGGSGIGWIIALILSLKKEDEPIYVYVGDQSPEGLKPANDQQLILEDNFENEIDPDTEGKAYQKKSANALYLCLAAIILISIATFLAYRYKNSSTQYETSASSRSQEVNVTSKQSEALIIPQAKKRQALTYDIDQLLNLNNAEELYRLVGEEKITKIKSYDHENNYRGNKYLLFKREDAEIEIDFIENIPQITLDKKTRWKVPFGLQVGMNINELLKINGEQISFLGFEHDNDGMVMEFNGGKLENQGIFISFKANSDSPNYMDFIGDSTFSTSDKNIESLDLRISEIRFKRH